MHFLSSLLFVVASFAFICFLFNFAADLVGRLGRVIAAEPPDMEFDSFHVIGAGTSFTYMMIYLFIW